jgi:hypothetical protein
MRKSIQIKDRDDAMRVFRFIHDNQESIYQANIIHHTSTSKSIKKEIK